MGDVERSKLYLSLKADKRLPSPPGAALRVLEVCRRDDADIDEIAHVIMSDPVLSGRLLKFANSSFVGTGREITSINQALLLLGIRAVKLTALGFSLNSPDLEPCCAGFELKKFWARSYAAAVIARHLADDLSDVDRDEAFTTTLLAGIGQLAMAHGLPKQYEAVLKKVNQGVALAEAESEVLGGDHVEFRTRLLSDWNLPLKFVVPVEYQLRPDEAPPHAQSLARLISWTSSLFPLFTGEAEGNEQLQEKARSVIENELHMDEKTWSPIAERLMDDYKQSAEIFDARLDDQASVTDLYMEAQQEATRVGMVAQLEQAKTATENEQLQKQATTDGLTGIPNRARFDQRLDELIQGVQRDHGHFAVILLDIDFFKKFNDTFGHQTGDLVLKRVAVAISNMLREVDFVARYGGEEFCILAPKTGPKDACLVAARVCKGIEMLRIPSDGQVLNVTVSLGIAVSSDYEQAPTGEQLVATADEQLYISKNAGRNTFSYHGRSAPRAPAVPCGDGSDPRANEEPVQSVA